MPRIIDVILWYRQKVAARQALHMEPATAIAFADIVDEWHVPHCAASHRRHLSQLHPKLRVAIPEHAAALAAWIQTLRPSGWIKVIEAIQWH